MGTLSEATHTRHLVKEPEDAGHLRRIVGELSRGRGASEAEAGRAELAVTKLATNLLRHADPGGSILVRPLVAGGSRGVEFLSVDSGPGMEDVSAFIHHGVPKASRHLRSGLGVGLASVQRLSTHFDVHSEAGKGTVVLSRHFFGDTPKPGAFEASGVSLARPGESVSGDGWAVAATRSPFSALLVDGLGHGPPACEAAQAAIAVLGNGYFGDIEDYIRKANAAMRSTRGGVLALARIDPTHEEVHFVGIGNIEGRIHLPDRSAVLTSNNGTLGVSMSSPVTRLVRQPWAAGAIMVLNSDGVRMNLGGIRSSGLFQRDPAVIAAVGIRDGFRGTDDATIVVVKDTRVAVDPGEVPP